MTAKRFILIIFLVGFVFAGCGNRADRAMMKQAKDALKQGNYKVSINNTKTVLGKSPNNILARRMKSKIKKYLTQEAEKSLAEKNYKAAIEKMEALLDFDPQDEKAKTLLNEAKKHVEYADGKKALDENNPMVALKCAQEALRIDPNFQEAKELETVAQKEVQVKIKNLVSTAQELIAQENFEKLRDLAQDILAIDPQNKEAADFLREALAQILTRNKAENLAMARKFYSEGIYESALAKAEEVLKVDPSSTEAKDLVQRSRDELTKPELRLTGLTKIKGFVIANIEVPSTRDKYMVKEGETFLNEGDFKVSAIDFDLKAVVITYMKTGSQQTISLAPPELNTSAAPPPEETPPAPPVKKKRGLIVR